MPSHGLGPRSPDRGPGGGAARLPIWNFCGDQDQPATVEANRAMAAALQQAGANARYTEYPMPHNCWDDAYGTDELHAWMLAQARSRNRS